MSKAPTLNPDDAEQPDDQDLEDVVDEHRELFERAADAGISLSEPIEGVLQRVEEGDTDV